MELQVNDQVVMLKGNLDRFHLTKKSHFLFPNLKGDIVVDLTQVNNFDTAGLAWLLKLVSFYQKKAASLTIENPSDQLIALARVSNVLALLPIKNN